ncbi:hypothetical protein [Fulvivirga kasyanovii]|uniref:Chromosome partitioning protein ParA n=1 Tax=Fulvivirga kasyanovii TaxID=396812 RepID=A0ABW9RQ10_9BACT|nr:hypothetical protein [Fulvivirga kasyanovii]MTI26243.1 hypothetical protein [Fulvivirga kasyanovii]
MKTSKETIIAGVVTVMFFTALGFALFYSSDNKTLNRDLKAEKLKSEKMLSQKLALDKDISKLKADIGNYQGKNKQLDGKLADMQKRLVKKENELSALMKQKALSDSRYKKQAAELASYKKQMEEEIAALNESLADMKFKNSYLQNSVATLEKNNSELNKRNSFLNESAGNNYGVEALKKNQKLTISSKKTKEIVLGFDVPASLASNLTLTVITPDGKKANSATSREISYTIIEENEPVLLASTEMVADFGTSSKRVALSYKPSEKFKKGVYKIDIYHQNTYLGSTQIKLK